MSKLWKGLKSRYLEGVRWMQFNEGLPSMMYLATTITILLVFFRVTPENAIQYVVTSMVNVIAIYLYSFVVRQFDMYGPLRIIQFVIAVLIGLLVIGTIGNSLNFLLLAILFVVPIIVAGSTIYLEENCTFSEDFYSLMCVNGFTTVIISTLLPMIVIAAPLFFLKWSIFTKIAIVLAFILIAPLVCWADSEDYGIFGALGIEW